VYTNKSAVTESQQKYLGVNMSPICHNRTVPVQTVTSPTTSQVRTDQASTVSELTQLTASNTNISKAHRNDCI